MSQPEFSKAYGFSLTTLRNWEQGIRKTDQATLSYLVVIAEIPELVATGYKMAMQNS
jgi:DNA-binding transcriptional regulator YiaG